MGIFYFSVRREAPESTVPGRRKLALFEHETLYGESKAAAGTDTGIRTGLFACHRKTEYISSSDPGYGTAADS